MCITGTYSNMEGKTELNLCLLSYEPRSAHLVEKLHFGSRRTEPRLIEPRLTEPRLIDP